MAQVARLDSPGEPSRAAIKAREGELTSREEELGKLSGRGGTEKRDDPAD